MIKFFQKIKFYFQKKLKLIFITKDSSFKETRNSLILTKSMSISMDDDILDYILTHQKTKQQRRNNKKIMKIFGLESKSMIKNHSIYIYNAD